MTEATAKKEPVPYSFKTVEGHAFSGLDGKMHSVGDKPAVTYADGTKWWYRNNLVHRDGDLPAVIWWNGVQEWWQNGQRHRDNGPAMIYPFGPGIDERVRGVKEWWTRGRLVKRSK